MTNNPNGNTITDADVAWWRSTGNADLIAEHESGRRQFIFGYNDGGSARITVRLPRKFAGLCNYVELLTASYQNSAPEPLAFITVMPNVASWWVVVSPKDSDSQLGIGPAAITHIAPVGEQTPAYAEALAEIQKWAEAA